MSIYANAGNSFAVAHIPDSARRILDVGCGAGDAARLIRARIPQATIEGVTFDAAEADEARPAFDKVHVFDLEGAIPADLAGSFDCMLFSHVLEHLRDPTAVLARFAERLTQDGVIVVALPNILEWRTRLKFMRGAWDYAETGMLDRTHIKFFTYESVENELMRGPISQQLRIVSKRGDGAVPLGPLRRVGALASVWRGLDSLGVKSRPNLFAQQFVLVLHKTDAARQAA